MITEFWKQAGESESLALALYEMVYGLNHCSNPSDTRDVQMRAKALRTRGRHLAEHLDRLFEASIGGGEEER